MRKALLVTVITFASLARAEYTEAPVTNGGTISGRITYDGTPPSRRSIHHPGPGDLRHLT